MPLAFYLIYLSAVPGEKVVMGLKDSFLQVSLTQGGSKDV